MTTGHHTRGERLSVHELVEQYETAQKDATATDEHMTYLRAHLELAASRRADEEHIEQALIGLCHEIDKLTTFLEADSRHGHASTTDAIFHLALYSRTLAPVKKDYEQFLKDTRTVEKSHARLIHLTKTRVNTQRKHTALHQLREFRQTIPRILALLEPRLEHATARKLQARLGREFSTLPARALQPNTLAITTTPTQQNEYAQRGTLIDKLAARSAAFGANPDMPHRDLLYLKAHVQALTGLHEITSITAGRLQHCQDVLTKFLSGSGFNKQGEPTNIRGILEDYRLGRQLEQIERGTKILANKLRSLEEELAERHARIIELASVVLDIELTQHTIDDANLQRHLIKRLHAVLLDVIPPPDIEYIRPHLPLGEEISPPPRALEQPVNESPPGAPHEHVN